MIGDVAVVQSGSGFPKKYQGRLDGSIPFYKVSDMSTPGNEREMVFTNNTITESERAALGASLLPPGCTIFPKIGGAIATNKKRQTTVASCVDNNVMGVIPKTERVLSDFLFYFFLAHDLSEFANEAHLPSIRKTVVEGWPIDLPDSLNEQRLIVEMLDEALAHVAVATANAEKNIRNARSILDSSKHAVFGQHRPGWMETTLDQPSANLDSRRIPVTKDRRTKGEYPYYGASGVVDYVDDFIFEGDALLVSEDGANLLMRSSPIAFSVSGKYWVNNHAHILQFESPVVQKLVEFYLESISLDAYVTGTAQPKLTQKALNSIPIRIPVSAREQSRIVGMLEMLQLECRRLEIVSKHKLGALDELKQALLQEAFTGQLALTAV